MSYNVNAPWGLQLCTPFLSVTSSNAIQRFPIANAYNSNLFNGDPVYVAADGTITIATAGSGNPISGVFQGVEYYSNIQGINGNYIFSPYWIAGTQIQANTPLPMALVCVDPYQTYNIQASGAIALTDINNNAALIAGNGSFYSGKSGWMLDSANIAPGPQNQLRIIRFIDIPGNVPGNFANVEVMINNNFYRSGTGTLGV